LRNFYSLAHRVLWKHRYVFVTLLFQFQPQWQASEQAALPVVVAIVLAVNFIAR
jgi:hypothetical protein